MQLTSYKGHSVFINETKHIKFFFFVYDNHFIFLSLNFFIVVQLQLSAFSLHPSTPPQLSPPPSPTSTLPLGFVLVSFIVVPENPSSHLLLPTPLWLLLHCSSMSLVIFCKTYKILKCTCFTF